MMAIEAGEDDPHYDEDVDRFRAHRLLTDPDYQSGAIDHTSGTERLLTEHQSPSNEPPQKKNKRSRNKKKATK
jgi:hypothetical protein